MISSLSLGFTVLRTPAPYLIWKKSRGGRFLFSRGVKVELEVSGACLANVGLNSVTKHSLKAVSRGVPAFNQISTG